MTGAPDCRTCGACCGPVDDWPTYVDLDDNDEARLSPRYRRLHVVSGHDIGSSLATKRGASGCVCVALRGSVGRRVSCAIYDRRPDACRNFTVGGGPCLAARADVLG